MARDTGKLTLAGPMQLAQGGLGVVGRLPIYLSEVHGERRFWGFSYVTLRFPEVLDAARLPVLSERGYAYELWRKVPETGEHQRIQAWNVQAVVDPVERTLALPNGAWTLSVAPSGGWYHPADRVLEGTVGVLISVLMAYLAWLLVCHAHSRYPSGSHWSCSAPAKSGDCSSTWKPPSTRSPTCCLKWIWTGAITARMRRVPTC